MVNVIASGSICRAVSIDLTDGGSTATLQQGGEIFPRIRGARDPVMDGRLVGNPQMVSLAKSANAIASRA